MCELHKEQNNADDHVVISLFTIHTGQRSIRELSRHNANFVWFHLLVDILIKMPPTEKTKEDMLNECRQFYLNDPVELKKIDDFSRKYPHGELTALHWYTCDTFLYRLFNKAFRTENIYILFKFRYFIAELYQELIIEHEKYLQKLLTDEKRTSLKVFRGQTMSKEEFDRIKANENGGLIAFNGFLSTSTVCYVSALFGGVDSVPEPNEVHVLFQIDIDFRQIATADYTIRRPFAELVDSTKEEEHEVLLSIGTIFQIQSIEEYDTMYYVQLVLQQEEDEEIVELIRYLKRDIDDDSLLLTFGDFLYDMGDYKKAEYYYDMLLEELPEDHIDIGKVHNNLGLIHYECDEYAEAALSYGKALQIFMEQDAVQFTMILWSNIADLLRRIGKGKTIPQCHELTLAINESIEPPNEVSLAKCYNSAGLILAFTGQYDEALIHFNQALSVQQEHLPHLHEVIPVTHYYIATVYKEKGCLKEALNHIEEALKLQFKALPDDHLRLGALYACRAAIYHDLGNLEEALEDYDRTLLIYKKYPVKFNLARAYNNIGLVWMDKGNYEISLIMYQKALRLIRDYNSTQSECTGLEAVILANTGAICAKYEQEGAEQALFLTNKALELSLEFLPKDHPRLAILYAQLGSIWDEKADYDTALKFYQRALDIQLNSEASEHNNMVNIYSNMALVYENKNELEKALTMYQKAIDRLEKNSSIHSDVAVVYLNISSLYHRLNKADDALQYAIKASDIAKKTLLDDHQIIKMCKTWLNKLVGDEDSTSDTDEDEQNT